jgi:hypothetical protein
MTPFGLQKELVDDRRRNLAPQNHRSAWPVRLETQGSAEIETGRRRALRPTRIRFQSMRNGPWWRQREAGRRSGC